VLGAAASVVGVRAAFSVVAGLAAVLAVAALWFEPSPPEPRSASLAGLVSRPFLLALWLITIPALLFGTLNVLAPLALSARGFGAISIGAIWVVAAGIESALNPWLGRVSDRRGPAVPIRFALAASIVVCVGLAATEWPWLLVPLVFGASIAFGSFYAPGMTMLSHEAEGAGLAQGLTFGMMNVAWAIGNAIGPAAGGGLAQVTRDAVPYLAGAGICAVTLAAFRRF
jgi:predicted MFS family arabinose efflux permease